jgi:endoglucanase
MPIGEVAMRTAHVAFGIGILAFAVPILAQAQSWIPTNRRVQLTGISISGAEGDSDNLPGGHGQNYTYPKLSTIEYFAANGMNIIRLPLAWERLQRQLSAKVDEAEMQRVDAVVNFANAKGMKVIVDVHNYARYFGAVIGSPSVPTNALSDLWRQIADRYKDNDLVLFGLMNEPHDMRTETWLEAANIAIAEIRRTGAKNLITVPGNSWSSARDWTRAHYGSPNSVAMLNVVDPGNNYVFEVHQYFDRDYTGTHPECQHVTTGVTSLREFTRWARTHRKRGFLGEFGAGENPNCLAVIDRVLRFMAENDDVWLGWAYWGAGPWWPKDYYTNLEPQDDQDPRPQMSVLKKYTRDIGSARIQP